MVPLTFTYQQIDGMAYEMDVYVPSGKGDVPLPALVYYHGGGLVCGNRGLNKWFPYWLLKDALAAGFVVISPSYTQLTPQSGHDIIKDIKAAFAWIESSLNAELAKTSPVRVDSQKLMVSGSSAGGWMSYMSALHANPKPKAIASIYGMFGDGLNPWYIDKKTKPFLWLYPKLLDDADFLPIYNTPVTSRLISTPIDSPRLDYFTWLLQEPRFIDALTGHKGLNAKLKLLPTLEGKIAAIPADSIGLFPLLRVDAKFPPTFFVHGDKDEAVPIEESRVLFQTLKSLGIQTRMVEVPGGNHDCDWVKDSSEVEGLVDVVPFLLKVLGGE